MMGSLKKSSLNIIMRVMKIMAVQITSAFIASTLSIISLNLDTVITPAWVAEY